MSQPLRLMQLPLSGTHMIEASAGTGKTYTLAMLYLRLVLNHGGAAAFGKALLPDEILVVTFTKAATLELRERIRARLVEAADYLALPTTDIATAGTPQAIDDPLHALYHSYSDEQRQQAAQLLLLAAESMDEAAIATIHAWCFRVLNEFALYYGGVFDANEMASEHELTQQACEDFWRLQVLPLSTACLAHFMTNIPSPKVLQQQITRLIPHLNALPDPAHTLAQCVSEVTDQLATIDLQLVALQKQLRDGAFTQLVDFFVEAEAQNAYQKTNLNQTHRQKALAKISDYLDNPKVGLDTENKSILRLALIDKSIWKQPENLTITSPLTPLVLLLAQKKQLSAKENCLVFATHWVEQRLQSVKTQQGMLSFNDQLNHLQHALASPQGEVLAAAIRKRFPVAMVDEFQDTDPVQYEIFSRIYLLETPHQTNDETAKPTTGFIMIGDPKQAIYSFRGGDIHTYLRAKKVVKQHVYTLSHNFRSDKDAINAVNALFTYADTHPYGAFRFAKQSTADDANTTDNPLPFLPVEAGKKKPKKLILNVTKADIIQQHGQNTLPHVAAQPALGAWLTPLNTESPEKPASKAQILATMATHCANEIAHLLTLASQGLAYLVDANATHHQGHVQPVLLTPNDMAILVADKKHAKTVRHALSQCGIASVYLSDQSNVYSTDIALELLYVLRAIAEPNNHQWVGLALSTQIMGASLATLDALSQDELLREEAINQLHDYQQIWQQKSLQACLYQVFFDQQTTQRLQANTDGRISGERQLTDVLHLLELLQQASYQVYGQQPLIRHFEELIQQAQDDKNSSDINQQRLESDDNLVKVVTYHKSKGLEYPVVFLPFISDSKAISKRKTLPYLYRDKNNQQHISLQLSDAILDTMQQEQLAEEVRKLYVALTRASYCQYIGLADNANFPLSGMGALLNASPTQSNIEHCLDALHQSITPLPLPKPGHFDRYQQRTDQPMQTARAMPALYFQPWRIASYSSLHFSHLGNPYTEPTAFAPESAQQAILQEESSLQTEPHVREASQHTDATPTIHNLPKGALYGTMLHDVLEWCAEQGFMQVLDDAQGRDALWQKKLPALQLQPWKAALDAWLCQFIAMPWDLSALVADPQRAAPFTLAGLSKKQIAVEMEFMLTTNHLDIEQVDALVCQHTWGQAPRPIAQAQHLNGLLKGYIDMVVEHQGQYFIIDWKSNYLGDTSDAYHHQAIQEALLSKRYDMQYVLYTLALHRLLSLRLPNYSYEQHIGGAVYAYLRGYQHANTQGLIMEKPSFALIDALDHLFKGHAHKIPAYPQVPTVGNTP